MDTDNDPTVPVAERLNVALVPQAATALAALQASTRLKKVDLVNRAITLYEFINDEMGAGNALILRGKDGRDQLVKLL